MLCILTDEDSEQWRCDNLLNYSFLKLADTVRELLSANLQSIPADTSPRKYPKNLDKAILSGFFMQVLWRVIAWAPWKPACMQVFHELNIPGYYTDIRIILASNFIMTISIIKWGIWGHFIMQSLQMVLLNPQQCCVRLILLHFIVISINCYGSIYILMA